MKTKPIGWGALCCAVLACGCGGGTTSSCPPCLLDSQGPDVRKDAESPRTDSSPPDVEEVAALDPATDRDPGLADPGFEVGKGQFGASCWSNADCESGFCVEGVDGFVCTKGCLDECPDGWVCRATLVGQDLMSLCVPAGVSLCKPCIEDSQCGDGKCLEIGGGRYCGKDCSAYNCPVGYECREVGGSRECLPANGACDCRPVHAGAQRVCVRENEHGRCVGVETCDPASGWVNCTAATPAPERCNGADDDCNGWTDEGWTGLGTVCVVGVGECQKTGVRACTADGGAVECNVTPGDPSPELCDGRDNDCDGAYDEDFPEKGKPCQVGQGECVRNGVFACRADGTGVECNASPGSPSEERCDDLDNDCDGLIDEDFATKGKTCFAGIGECLRPGVFVCREDGTDVRCNAVAGPVRPEVCDGLDNDCDGLVDEEWPDKGQVCLVGLGECQRAGTLSCNGEGTGLVCSAGPGAEADEVCDGKDNDCDGLVDEDWQDKGKACVVGLGECVRTGVFVCGPDGSDVECNASPGPVQPEVCDGKDNDCDGLVDEDFPQKGQVCLVGQGECQRAGTLVCNAAGTGLQCSATPGAGTQETCDGKDNDCDGSTDEEWPDKGKVCTVGTGVCLRTGTYVCNPAQTGIICNATAGSGSVEVCDYLDNDCDGSTDEDFIQNGKYYRNTACGNCYTDCTAIYNLPHAFGTCDASGTPTCRMNCSDTFYDLNAVPDDGCEFGLDATAIYVSSSDPTALDDGNCGLGPSGTLAGAHPCKTIAQGLARATATGRAKVLVADGLYEETVTLVAGKSLLGGYRADTWERHLGSTLSTIRGTGGGTHLKTLVADGITTATTVEGFLIYGPNNTQIGGNSYAIWVRNSSSALVIRSNTIYGGSGGPGANGAHGANGSAGANGSPGSPAKQVAANCREECTSAMETPGGSGGSKTCEGSDVSGGAGGRAVCPDFQENSNMCNQCSTQENQTIAAASNGQPGAGGGGAGGSGGYDSMIDGGCFGDCSCYVPNGERNGANGADGPDGSNGSAGSGCATASGSVSGAEWVGGSGTSGSAGTHGRGGGGGGAGGGVETYFSSVCAAYGTSDIGGSGGGGGSGGCRGLGGAGGGAGGGAFDLFLVWTGGASSAPVIEGNVFTRGFGGIGGQGGNGGTGGPGGLGANGGASGAGSTATFCAPAGGKGGQGGDGGHGGGGGGGCGGASYEIFASGQGALNLSAYKSQNTYRGGGSGGPGGAGGGSMGLPGTAGSAGATADFNF